MSDLELMANGQVHLLKNVLRNAPNKISFDLNGTAYEFELIHQEGDDQLFLTSKHLKECNTQRILKIGKHFISHQGVEICIERPIKSRAKKTHHDVGQMLSPMPGKILKVLVVEGQVVKAREPLLVMEAMKMEHTIFAATDGKIAKIHFKEGEQVTGGVELVLLC